MNMFPSNQEFNSKSEEFSKGSRQAEGVFGLLCQVKGFVWMNKNYAALLDARETILEEWREKCMDTAMTSTEIIKAIVHIHTKKKTFKEIIRASFKPKCEKFQGSGQFCTRCDYGKTTH